MIKPLTPEMLCQQCDPNSLPFTTTADLTPLTEIIGQPRAMDAITFGVEISQYGYNLFALGPSGVGKHSILRKFLAQRAAAEPAPPDWCYVNNFEDPQKPQAMMLPAGRGAQFRQDMERLIEELHSGIPAAFEGDEYRARKQVIENEIKERREKFFADIRKRGEEKGIGLMRTPTGFVFAPVRNGEIVTPEEFEKLTPAEHKRIENDMADLQRQLQAIMREEPFWEREGREQIKKLNREVTNYAVGHLIDELRNKYADEAKIVGYLDAARHDVSENVHQFLAQPESPLSALMGGGQARQSSEVAPFFRRYRVNLIVDHGKTQGAPVVHEDHPTFANLIGQSEYAAQFGALVTDFSMLRPGALHKANGGYLILDATQVLMQPYSWEGIKRALRSTELRIESVGQMLGILSAASLEPEPIPLKVKVVLLGERTLYYLLCQADPEFNDLFKVAVDFEENMERSEANSQLYARFIALLAKEECLLPFDKTGVARVLQRAIRDAGDTSKLSIHRRSLADLLRESDYWARKESRSAVRAQDVQHAVDSQIHRLDRIRERYQEQIVRGTILIDTKGEKVGQVNGLSVVQVGQFAFGHPTRITARVRLGRGEVVDIEREVELGGPIHSKGVLILSGFLGARYAADRPLSLSASLVFEQSYGGVEGDSASSAELYTLLSALSRLPIKQCFAVTGSVNQHGEVQAIGGANEKIEGFFDVCKARGLTGKEGVLIPASNVKHLMLREDVVKAVADGMFSVYPVETIDQGIEILTGVVADERDASGQFPEDSVNRRVEARLIELAQKRMEFGAPPRTGAGNGEK